MIAAAEYIRGGKFNGGRSLENTDYAVKFLS